MSSFIMNAQICSVLLPFVLLLIVSNEVIGELVSVVVLYRHGDRTPTRIYPKDPYQNVSHYWPEGLGQITNAGIKRQYELGKWFRNRYKDFLREEYSREDLLVLSSDKDRTLMSALANLAGLYPPTKEDTWNKNIPWRPIPVHTLPLSQDTIIARKKRCPKYEKLYADLMESSFFTAINEENKNIYDFLTKNTGWKFNNVRKAQTLYSILEIEQQNNLILPSWTKPVFPKKLEPLASLSFASFSFTPQLARLNNGPFFSYVFSHFDDVINRKSNLKMLMLSGHDLTITSVMAAMEVLYYHCPDFAATMIWELWRKNDIFYVNLFYKNNTMMERLKLPTCDYDCEYNKFKSDLQYVTVNEKVWNEECTS